MVSWQLFWYVNMYYTYNICLHIYVCVCVCAFQVHFESKLENVFHLICFWLQFRFDKKTLYQVIEVAKGRAHEILTRIHTLPLFKHVQSHVYTLRNLFVEYRRVCVTFYFLWKNGIQCEILTFCEDEKRNSAKSGVDVTWKFEMRFQ